MNVQRARCTAGRLRHTTGPQAKSQQVALVVLDTSFVGATHWKLYVLILLLILTLKRTESVLLK